MPDVWFTFLISKHCAIDTADPSSMQVMCHMTFIIDLAHCGVFVAQSIGARNPKESKGLRFDSSWGLRIFFCPTLVTRQKNIFLYKNGYVRFDAIS